MNEKSTCLCRYHIYIAEPEFYHNFNEHLNCIFFIVKKKKKLMINVLRETIFYQLQRFQVKSSNYTKYGLDPSPSQHDLDAPKKY